MLNQAFFSHILSGVRSRSIAYLLAISLFNLLIMSAAVASAKKTMGKVVFTKGIVTSTHVDGSVQILGRGGELNVGDLIHTGEKSKAILKLIDGTQISLIQNTDFKVKVFSLEKANQKAELQLLKGGLRAITGIVNKNKTGRFTLSTPVASIGIRGTDFTSYLCSKNCQDGKSVEAKGDDEVKIDTVVTARIIIRRGDVTAKDSHGKIRQLHKDSPLYEGETIITGRKSIAVLAFKDNSRTTLQSNTQFSIDDYAFKPKQPKKSHASFKLIKGSLRFLTGKIGKLNREKYVIKTPTSSIGIRGTGFDLSFDQATHLYLWNGAVNFVYPNGEMVVTKGKTYVLATRNSVPKLIKQMPKKFQSGPRPDNDDIKKKTNIKSLFGSQQTKGKVGLYVHVKEGEVAINRQGSVLNLGKNESGFMNKGSSFRLIEVPKFLIKQFIPPNLDKKSLTRITAFPELAEKITDDDSGSICEVK